MTNLKIVLSLLVPFSARSVLFLFGFLNILDLLNIEEVLMTETSICHLLMYRLEESNATNLSSSPEQSYILQLQTESLYR